jgi:hypothetical protein
MSITGYLAQAPIPHASTTLLNVTAPCPDGMRHASELLDRALTEGFGVTRPPALTICGSDRCCIASCVTRDGSGCADRLR